MSAVDLLLTAVELHSLTGYRQPSRQLAELRRLQAPALALHEALMAAGIYRAEHDADPRAALNELICWHVSSEFQRLREELQRLREALRECEMFVRVLGLQSEPAAKVAADARAALAQREEGGA